MSQRERRLSTQQREGLPTLQREGQGQATLPRRGEREGQSTLPRRMEREGQSTLPRRMERERQSTLPRRVERERETLEEDPWNNRRRNEDFAVEYELVHSRCHATNCNSVTAHRSPVRFQESRSAQPYHPGEYLAQRGEFFIHTHQLQQQQQLLQQQQQQLKQQQQQLQQLQQQHRQQGLPPGVWSGYVEHGGDGVPRGYEGQLIAYDLSTASSSLCCEAGPGRQTRYLSIDVGEVVLKNPRLIQLENRGSYATETDGSQISLSSGYYSPSSLEVVGDKSNAGVGASSPAPCRLHGTPSRERRGAVERGGSVSSELSCQEFDRNSLISGIERISLLSSSSTHSTLERSICHSTACSNPSTHSTCSTTSTPRIRHRGLRSNHSPQVIQSEPPSPGHSYCEGEQYLGEREERTPGCCSMVQQDHTYSALSTAHYTTKQPLVSNCVKSFMSWMASKAEKSTAAILDSLPSLSREDFHVVMIGLDGAGKTTALYRLKFDQYINTVPTIGFNCERIKGSLGKSRGLTFLVWDVGGQEKIRPLWRSYTRCTDGIIFVVDSANSQMFEEAKVELFRTMRYQDNCTVPLLVLANKQDLPTAASASEVEEALGLKELNSSLWQVEASCSITGDGLDTALENLHHLILKKKKMVKRNRNKTK